MVTYNPFKNLYKVFGKTLPEKRAKRDGRNPATGAFSSNTASGAVDLTIDVAMVKGTRNVVLPDKTKYSKHGNSPDVAHQDFKDRVTHVFTLDEEDAENSTLILSDAYGNDVSLPLGLVNGPEFIFGSNEPYVETNLLFPGMLAFRIGDNVYIYGSARRTHSGMLLMSGTEVNTKENKADVEIGFIFPQYEP